MRAESAFGLAAPKPPLSASAKAGLYVHVPFCRALCPYCDFAVNVSTSARRARYAPLLLAELDWRGAPERPFDTLYFGGGTPSLLGGEELSAFIVELGDRRWIEGDCRIYLEANPEDTSPELLRSLRAAGVGTLSLGIQSLDDDELRFLGRGHDGRRGRQAVEWAKSAGFETVSLDLMYGLPGQSEARWASNLKTALELEPDHLSCYQLTVHERTRFGRQSRDGRLPEATEERKADLFRFTHRFLGERGLEGYEVSNFARAPEHRSRHNEKYWSHTPYLGLGPSAHSFDGRTRAWNWRSFFDWQRALQGGQSPVEDVERLDDDALLLETLMLRFRTVEGLDLDAVQRRFSIDLLERNRPLVEKLLDDTLLVREGARLRPTVEGLAVADGVAASFRWDPVSCRTA